jgi:hypothetical protein
VAASIWQTEIQGDAGFISKGNFKNQRFPDYKLDIFAIEFIVFELLPLYTQSHTTYAPAPPMSIISRT